MFEKFKKKDSFKKGVSAALAATVLAGGMNVAIKNENSNEKKTDIDAIKQPDSPRTI